MICLLCAVTVAVLGLAACGPTTSGSYPNVRILADVLTPTAGAPVVVSGSWAQTSAFAVRIPPGWQTRTPPASASPGMVFEGGSCTTITVTVLPVASDPPDECDDVPLRFVMRGQKVNGQTVLIVAMAPVEGWEQVRGVFEAIQPLPATSSLPD